MAVDGLFCKDEEIMGRTRTTFSKDGKTIQMVLEILKRSETMENPHLNIILCTMFRITGSDLSTGTILR